MRFWQDPLVPQVGVNLDWRTSENPTRYVSDCCFNRWLVTLDRLLRH